MAQPIAKPESPQTVQVFIVLADGSAEHKNQRLGMFFRALDADAHAATLNNGMWTNVRVIAEQLPTADVHPAHAKIVSSK